MAVDNLEKVLILNTSSLLKLESTVGSQHIYTLVLWLNLPTSRFCSVLTGIPRCLPKGP